MRAARATFIVGHPRSGTSLLRAMLDGHPDLLVIPFETHLFDWAGSPDPVAGLLDRTRLWPTLHRHEPSISRDEVEEVLERAFAEARSPRARLLALVDGWREITEAAEETRWEETRWEETRRVEPPWVEPRWVEKTPRHLYETKTLLRWFPDDARILVMRRDPRDVIASALKQKASRTIFQLALTGRLAHRVATEHERDPRVSVIGYEALVQDPMGVMQSVCRFLEIPYDPVVATPTVLGAPYLGNSRFDSAMHGVSDAAVGRYREALSESQLEKAETLLASVLSDGGYDPTLPNRPSRHQIARAAITMIVGSGLWRSRALRAAFGGA